MEIAKFQKVRTPKLLKRLTKKYGMADYVSDDSLHAKTQNESPTEGGAAYV